MNYSSPDWNEDESIFQRHPESRFSNFRSQIISCSLIHKDLLWQLQMQFVFYFNLVLIQMSQTSLFCFFPRAAINAFSALLCTSKFFLLPWAFLSWCFHFHHHHLHYHHVTTVSPGTHWQCLICEVILFSYDFCV